MKGNCLITENLSFTPYDLKWFPCSARLCVVGATKQGTGHLAVYEILDRQLQLQSETETNAAIRCTAITGQSRHIVAGDFEGQIQTWDPQKLDVPLTSVKAHQSIINSLDSLNHVGEPAEIVSGSRDGSVKVWDMRQPEKAVLSIVSKNSTKDIWAVKFGWVRGCKVIAVGNENGTVQLFDVNGSHYLWETKLKSGICSLDFNNGSLLVGTLSGVCIIDIESKEIHHVQSAQETTMWSLRQSPETDYFTVAGGDGTLSTYNSKKLTAAENVLNLSKHPVTSLDWNIDKRGLFACSAFDKTVRIGIIQ